MVFSAELPSATFRPAALFGGAPSPGAGHLPFAADVISALTPAMIVELGVASGDTYFGFCQSVAEQDPPCTCYGIDPWQAHNQVFDAVSRYNKEHYHHFSHLLRRRYDDALTQFADGSISLLNLEGLQPYEALRNTFDAWFPKVQEGGVILLHDISLRGGEAGAWRLWDQLQTTFPHFSLRHSHGLGMLAKSAQEADKIPFLRTLFRAEREQQDRIRRYYVLCSERLELAARMGACGAAGTGCALLQVLRSEGGNYESDPDLSQLISPGAWINLHLDLPQGVGDRPLRIDIANRPAVVDIAAITLHKADGAVLWSWNPKDITDQLRVEGTATQMPAHGSPAPDFCRVLSLGSAPHVFLPEFRGHAFEQALDLEIRLRIDLELAAVREMNQKWADLEQANTNGMHPEAVEAIVSQARSEAAKHLAQARLEHENRIKSITTDAEARLAAMRADFEHQSAQYLLQYEEERRAHQATIVDRDQLIAKQPRFLQEISISQGNVEDLKAELERVSTELANAEYDLTELRKLNARIAASLEQERAGQSDSRDTGAWQISKPFRAVGDLFGPRKKY